MPFDEPLNPNDVLDDVIRQRAPDIAQGGLDPNAMMDRLIRRNIYGPKPQPKPTTPKPTENDFDKFGSPPESSNDYDKFGSAPAPEPPSPPTPVNRENKGDLQQKPITAAAPEPAEQTPNQHVAQDFEDFGRKPDEAPKSGLQTALGALDTAADFASNLNPVQNVAKWAGKIPETAAQIYKEFQEATPADKAKPPEPGADWEIKKGLVGGIVGQTPKLAGGFAEALGHGFDIKTLQDKGAEFSKYGEEASKPYAPRVGSYRNIRTDSVSNFLQDFGSYAGYSTGQMASSSAPGLVIGGAAMGLTALAGPASPIAGRIAMAAGNALPSYIQNTGDMWHSAIEDKDIAKLIEDGKLTKKQVGQMSLLAGVPMAALDAYNIDNILGKKIGQQAKQDLTKRILKGIAEGSISEGSTEALQQVIEEWALDKLGSHKSLYESFVSVVDNMLGGVFGGAAMGGAGSAMHRAQAQPQADPQAFVDQHTPAGTKVTLNGKDYVSAGSRASGAPPAGGAGAETAAPQASDRAHQETGVVPEPKPADDLEVLRRAGFPANEIRHLTADEIKSIADEARGYGVHAGEEPAEPARAGTRAAPIEPKTAEDVVQAASVADQDHSPEQGEANNVQRGHMRWGGLDITIEAPPGGKRRGTAPDGTPFETEHPHAYGYLKGVPPAADGQAPDIVMGDHPTAPTVYVIDEVDPETGKYRQSKSFAGFETPHAAIESYLAISSKDESHLGGIRAFSRDDFAEMARSGGLSKPVVMPAGSAGSAETIELSGEGKTALKLLSAGPEHHLAIADAVRSSGFEPATVNRPILEHAAELHANGAPPDQAFQVAVARDLIASGHITPETVRSVLPHEQAEPLLEARRGAGRQPSAQASGAATRRTPAAREVERSPRRAADGGTKAAESGRPENRPETAPARGGEDRRSVGHEPTGRERAAATGPAEKRAGQQRDAGGAADAVAPQKLVVARLMPNGSVRYGKPGQIHADLETASERAKRPYFPPPTDTMGWAPPGGAFMTRDEALKFAEKHEPARAAMAHEPTGLEARKYQAAENGLIGKPVSTMPAHSVTDAAGTKIKVAPIVVEAADLITSADAGYDQSLQPRNRDRAASQAQVREIATRLDPERLGYSSEADRGAPIVGPDRMVESGNGRIAALRKLYENRGPNAKKYRDWLTGQGVDVAAYKEPILVRQRMTELTPAERQAFTVAANQAATLAMSAPERALADAKHLSPRLLDMIEDATNLSAASNRAFVRSFIAAIPASERGALTNAEGHLSAEGMTRARNAVLAKAYGDADLLSRITESTDDDIKSISNALVAAAPQWAKFRAGIEDGTVRADLDLTPELMEAVKITSDLRGRGQKLEAYLRQVDAFDRLPGEVETFMRMFYDPTGRRAAGAPRIADGLRFVAEQGQKVTTDPSLDLGAPEVTADEIQRAALAKAQEGLETDGVQVGGEGAHDGARGAPSGAEARRQQPGANRQGPGERGDGLRAGLAERDTDLFGPTERTAAGQQGVLPGAERISGAELARRRAAAPLKPKVAQKSLEGGLFGDENRQSDLVEQAGKPNIPGKEPADERNRRGPAEAVPGGAPGAAAKAPPANAGRAGKRQVAGQLSLFDGEPSPGPVSHGPVATQPGPQGAGNGEPAGQSPDVTKPPSAGGGKRPRNPDRNGPRARPGADGLAQVREKIAERSRLNYRITDDDHIGEGGPKVKARANLEAIRILKQVEEEGRQATPEEKAVLVKYTGWGALAQPMFKDAKKDWAPERAELRALLTDEEFEGARASTPNAHYTSPDVVRGMWDILDHLGYKGGLAIEPSAGIGHFIGLTPDKVLPKTAWTAVELDPISGRIAKALYAGAEVNVHGFEDLKRPSNYYDLAISNVPFGNYPLSEKPYGTFSIHDFFFVKSLDKVRPGGVVAFITSRFTMDKGDDSIRRILDKKADLVGAIRLPGGSKGAFAKNAGTDVTTDILFLRKKIPGETPFEGHDWLGTKEIQTPEGPTEINEYFASHPEMMMGEMRLQGTMYGTEKNEPVLIGPSDGLRERLGEAARAGMPEGALTPRVVPPPTLQNSEIEGPVKDGAFFLKDGKLYQKRQGVGVEHAVNTDDHDRIRRFVQMRGMVNDMLAAQIAGNKEESVQQRTRLNAAYDAFVRKWGPINKEVRTVTTRKDKTGEPVIIVRRPNFNPLRGDPDAFKVAAIENYDAATGKAKPAPALLRDVIDPPKQRQINGPVDALAVSLDDTGGIDLNHIADSLGVDSLDEVVKQLGDLIYQNPDGRAWETAEDYLSGNVVKKLEDARAIAEQDKSFERNVKALEKIQPTPLTQAEITAQLGAPWIPTATYEDFFKTGLGAARATVRQVPVTGGWTIDLDGLSRDAQSRYGTDRVSVKQVANAAFNNTSIIVRERPGPGETTGAVNAAASELARTKVAALQEAFTGDLEAGIEGWVWQHPDRSKELEAIYNRTHNNLVAMKLDGSHLSMPGLNPMFLEHKHRMDAVWRMIRRGNTLLAHVVGSGKTVTMIAGGMEMKRLGLINKPAYVVPNHMLEQFSREFLQAYPNAKILVASKEQTTRENRREFLAKVATNDWDGVIITHDTFGRINMRHEFRAQYIRDQLSELERIIAAESAQPGGKSSPTVKDLEKAKKRLRGKLDKLLNAERHDEGTSFEESGIDHIFLDEAHRYKNLSFITRMGRVKGLAQGDAQRAEDMFLKIRYLEQKRPGRSAVFATGTPVSNTMAELWTMQRYLQLDTLKEHGLDLFDNWANTFGRIVTNAETGPDGRTTRDVSSFSKFVNIPELVSIYSEIADSKTADMLNLKRPIVESPSGKRGIEIVESELSPEEDTRVQELVAMLEQLKGKRAKKGEPNVLSHVVTPGRKLATDGRLVGLPFNPNGKIGKAVENIHEIWKTGKEPGTVQMVFLDNGVPKTKGASRYQVAAVGDGWAVIDKQTRDDDHDGIVDTFETEAEAKGHAAELHAEDQRDQVDLHADLKGRLVAKGIPANQIALIHDANTDEKKGKLFAKVRSGEVRVLLGTTEKMGVGTNVQDRLIAMHHIDAPWKPAEVEQRDGRIVRQGNKNPKVRILRYVTPRSFDALMWQILERKAAFIAQVTSGTKGIRSAEDIDNPLPEAAEMKAAAAGDVRILEVAELDRKVRQLAAGKRNFEITKQRAGSEQGSAKSALARYEKELPPATDDAARVEDLRGDKFKVTLGGEEIIDRKAAGDKIIERMNALDTFNFYSPKEVTVGRMSGFDMVIRVQTSYDGDAAFLRGDIELHGERVYRGMQDVVFGKQFPSSPEILIRRFANLLDGIKAEPARIEKLIATEKDNLARIEKTLKEVWPREKEFRDAQAKLEALKREMKEGPRQVPGSLPETETAWGSMPAHAAPFYEGLAEGASRFDVAQEHYVDQAMANLAGTSRTAQGVVDVSSGGAAKAEKMVEGLTGEQAAANAKRNFEAVIRDLYTKRDDMPEHGPGMEGFIDDVASRINQGIVKPGELMRTHEVAGRHTAIADLAEAHRQFGEELAARLADPDADPIETAAFIEWRANIVDHFWSDGVGKTSKALAAIPLMRAGLPLPKYPSSKEFFSHAPPRGTWKQFNAFYHGLIAQPQETTYSPERAELQELLDQNAPIEDLINHPAVVRAVAENRSRVPTGTAEDFANPEWRAKRVYDFDGEKVAGWDAAVPRLVERARAMAGGPVVNGHHAVIVLGPPAAGKSSIATPIARDLGAAVVDADDAKLVIPEYHGGLGTNAVHEESSELAREVLEAVIRDGGNIVLPKVGHNAESIRRLVDVLKKLGYTVDLAHIAATPELSQRRNISRFLRKGRLVDPNYIAEVGDIPRQTAYLLRGEANDFVDVDTSQSTLHVLQGSGRLAERIRDGQDVSRRADAGSGERPGGEGQEGLTPGLAENGPGPAEAFRPVYDEIRAEQDGIGTVYIGDIIARSGLPKDVVHEALLESQRRGELTLHGSSAAWVRRTKAQQDGAFPKDHPGAADDTRISTVVFKDTAGLAEGRPFSRAALTGQVIPSSRFNPRRGIPLGQQAQDYVLERGGATGVEHAVAVHANGKVAFDVSGTANRIDFTPTQDLALKNPANAIVVHHNHPSNRALSSLDLTMLANPGLAAVWAHGHGGNVFRASATSEAREAFNRMPGDKLATFFRLINHMEQPFYGPLRRMVNDNTITAVEAERLHDEMVSLALARAGIIDYQSNTGIDSRLTELGLDPYIDRSARYIHGKVFSNAAIPASLGDGRRAQPLRHPGDLGASFGRAQVAAGERAASVRDDRQGRAQPRSRQKAQPGQLRLPGLEAPPTRYGPSPPRPTGVIPGRRAAAGLKPKAGSLENFKKFWQSTFQPELVSDRAFEADPAFAQLKSGTTQEKDALYHSAEAEWDYWNRLGDIDRIEFLDRMERGAPQRNAREARMARRYRAMLDANWAMEKRFGSQASFVQDYFPHIWESEATWNRFATTMTAQVGPTWFQKKRTIDLIKDGLAQGLKLKYTNPIDIITHRLMSGADMRQRMMLIYKLKGMGLAWEGAQGGALLARRGWQTITAPDRKQWVIAPDVQLLWKNAVEAKGLWQVENAVGGIFRGWMTFKNVWVPVKLALSAFHPLHVLHINWSDGLARAWNELTTGHPIMAARSIGQGVFGPMEAAPGASIGAVAGAFLGSAAGIGPYWGGMAGAIAGSAVYAGAKKIGLAPQTPHLGRSARAGWKKRASQQTADERAMNALMVEGGFVPQLPEQIKIAAKRQLHESFQKALRGEAGGKDWRKLISASMRRPIEALQSQIFEEWIPNIKAAAYLHEAASLLQRNPGLLNDDIARGIALRSIGEQVHSRFGEKFYGTMFWDRYVKDTAVASFLSLGWNYGFVHQFGGAAMEAVTRPAGLIPAFRPSAGRAERRAATNKISFALAYLGSAALLMGLISLGNTGEPPEGLDWIFPRIGGKNPDGSPRRITNMTYLREWPMLMKHIQESNSVFWGAMEMLGNKLMFAPFKELLTNRNYYGYNIYDENAPKYEQMWQSFKYMIGDQTNPMSVSGAKHAAELSSKPFPGFAEALANPDKLWSAITAKGVGESVAGFGPAPGYVEKTAIQNRIAHLYQAHVAPAERTYEEGQASPEKMSARTAIALAKQNKDSAALKAAYEQGRKAGLKPDAMGKIGNGPTDVYLFSRLPAPDQRAILRDASPEEYKRYIAKASKATVQELRLHPLPNAPRRAVPDMAAAP